MKVYPCEIGTPTSEESNKFLLDIELEIENKKEELSKNQFSEYVFELHNCLRRYMKLPDKVFAINMNKEYTEAQLIFFDKEPDGKYYNVSIEEIDGRIVPYIEVEE